MVSSCFYFHGLDFSNQTLVITEGREDNCSLPKTSNHGERVRCEGNATATRLNETHVLLETNGGSGATYIMNYGKDGEPGESTFSYNAACPTPPGILESTKNGGEHPDWMYAVYVILAIIIIIIIILTLAYIIYKKRKQAFWRRNSLPGVVLKAVCSGMKGKVNNSDQRLTLMEIYNPEGRNADQSGLDKDQSLLSVP